MVLVEPVDEDDINMQRLEYAESADQVLEIGEGPISSRLARALKATLTETGGCGEPDCEACRADDGDDDGDEPTWMISLKRCYPADDEAARELRDALAAPRLRVLRLFGLRSTEADTTRRTLDLVFAGCAAKVLLTDACEIRGDMMEGVRGFARTARVETYGMKNSSLFEYVDDDDEVIVSWLGFLSRAYYQNDVVKYPERLKMVMMDADEMREEQGEYDHMQYECLGGLMDIKMDSKGSFAVNSVQIGDCIRSKEEEIHNKMEISILPSTDFQFDEFGLFDFIECEEFDTNYALQHLAIDGSYLDYDSMEWLLSVLSGRDPNISALQTLHLTQMILDEDTIESLCEAIVCNKKLEEIFLYEIAIANNDAFFEPISKILQSPIGSHLQRIVVENPREFEKDGDDDEEDGRPEGGFFLPNPLQMFGGPIGGENDQRYMRGIRAAMGGGPDIEDDDEDEDDEEDDDDMPDLLREDGLPFVAYAEEDDEDEDDLFGDSDDDDDDMPDLIRPDGTQVEDECPNIAFIGPDGIPVVPGLVPPNGAPADEADDEYLNSEEGEQFIHSLQTSLMSVLRDHGFVEEPRPGQDEEDDEDDEEDEDIPALLDANGQPVVSADDSQSDATDDDMPDLITPDGAMVGGDDNLKVAATDDDSEASEEESPWIMSSVPPSRPEEVARPPAPTSARTQQPEVVPWSNIFAPAGESLPGLVVSDSANRGSTAAAAIVETVEDDEDDEDDEDESEGDGRMSDNLRRFLSGAVEGEMAIGGHVDVNEPPPQDLGSVMFGVRRGPDGEQVMFGMRQENGGGDTNGGGPPGGFNAGGFPVPPEVDEMLHDLFHAMGRQHRAPDTRLQERLLPFTVRNWSGRRILDDVTAPPGIIPHLLARISYDRIAAKYHSSDEKAQVLSVDSIYHMLRSCDVGTLLK